MAAQHLSRSGNKNISNCLHKLPSYVTAGEQIINEWRIITAEIVVYIEIC